MPNPGSLRTVGALVHVFFRSRRVKFELRLRKSMKNEGHGGPHRIFCGHFQALGGFAIALSRRLALFGWGLITEYYKTSYKHVDCSLFL